MKKWLNITINSRYFHRILIVFIVLSLFILYKWSFYYDTTTNYAFTWAQTIDMSSDVSGEINSIDVSDYSYVKQGDKILSIDSKPYQYAYNKAKANYEEMKIAYQTIEPQINEAKSALQQAITDFNVANDHLDRIRILYKKGSISQTDYIDTKAAVKKAEEAVKSSQNNLDIVKSKANYTELEKAQADYDIAKYNLKNTTITAPSNGYTVNLLAQTGSYINRGQPLFGIVKSDEWWVVGRFRETVIRHIHVGDKAEVSIDMYPDKTFHGYVDRIGWGINRRQSSSEAATSTLPYLEATEYWIRISQRFPVWVKLVDLDDSTKLRVGGNAKVSILNEKYTVYSDSNANL